MKVLWNLERMTVLVVTPQVFILKDQVEEMRHLRLKALAIGIGEEEADRELCSSADIDII